MTQLAQGRDPDTGEPFGSDVQAVFDTFLRRNVPASNEVFLTFLGQGDCRVETRLRVDAREEGALADVQGMVPFVTTHQVDAQPPSPMLCAGQQWVLDTATGTLWSHGSLGLGSARGQRVHTSGGRTERSEVDIDAGWHEAAPWIAEKMRRMPVQGEARHTLPVAAGQGQVRVTMRWRFE